MRESTRKNSSSQNEASAYSELDSSSPELKADVEATRNAIRFSAILARYNRCPNCGAHLHFSHLTDFARNLTQESAKCLECGNQSKQSMHRLQ